MKRGHKGHIHAVHNKKRDIICPCAVAMHQIAPAVNNKPFYLFDNGYVIAFFLRDNGYGYAHFARLVCEDTLHYAQQADINILFS